MRYHGRCLSGIVTLAMFFLSGYMITQSALGAPLYALMILVVSVKLFGFKSNYTLYRKITYTRRHLQCYVMYEFNF